MADGPQTTDPRVGSGEFNAIPPTASSDSLGSGPRRIDPRHAPAINAEAGDRSESEQPPADEALEETRIDADGRLKTVNVAEIWKYRRLLYFFVWRDIKVRYKQTVLGAAWAILQPTMMMVVFAVFLGRVAGVSSGDLPYPVFLYAGLLPWTLFSASLSLAGNSVIGSGRFINKIYFPRLLIPFGAIGPAVIDFFIAFGVLLVLMLCYGIMPTWSFPLVLLPVLLLIVASLAGGIILAALNVWYRDFRYAIPFLIQMLMFATPAIYMHTGTSPAAEVRSEVSAVQDSQPETSASAANEAKSAPAERSSRVPSSLRWMITWNPLTGMIHFFRAATLGDPLPWTGLGTAAAVVTVAFIFACHYYRYAEDSFADII